MKALEILKKELDTETKRIIYSVVVINNLEEAIKEIEELDNDLKDLFSCIELTEDESYEKRFTSLETYLIRLSKFIK